MQTGDIVGAVGVLRALVDRNRRESAWVALARTATSLAVILYEAGDINAAVDVGSQCLATSTRPAWRFGRAHPPGCHLHVRAVRAR